jgi:stress response protein SCP2
MTVLSRGANGPLTTGPVDVAVAGARQGSVDLLVFQLGPDRKVRTDADFVFFNQPASPEGAVRLVAADRVTADLTAVPAAIETLAIAVALDDGVPGSLAGIPGLAVTISGGESHRADASGLTVERAAVLVEIYRRGGGWKVRNVSAGWAAGLSALAAEHGVSVDESPAAPVDPAVALPSPLLSPPATSAGVRPAGPLPAGGSYPNQSARAEDPSAVSGYPPAAQPGPAVPPGHGYPMPGGFPPPGGSLPPPPEFVPPRPGGWPPPGGSLPA